MQKRAVCCCCCFLKVVSTFRPLHSNAVPGDYSRTGFLHDQVYRRCIYLERKSFRAGSFYTRAALRVQYTGIHSKYSSNTTKTLIMPRFVIHSWIKRRTQGRLYTTHDLSGSYTICRPPHSHPEGAHACLGRRDGDPAVRVCSVE